MQELKILIKKACHETRPKKYIEKIYKIQHNRNNPDFAGNGPPQMSSALMSFPYLLAQQRHSSI
jgi:hypothetical protein